MHKFKQRKIARVIKKELATFDNSDVRPVRPTTRELLTKIIIIVSGMLFIINSIAYYGHLLINDNVSSKNASLNSAVNSVDNQNKKDVNKIETNDESVYKIKAEEALKENKEREAIEYYKKALAVNEKNAHVLTDIVNLLVKNKLYDESLTYLDMLVSVEPKNVSAYKVKGSCLYLLNRYDEAIKVYSKVVEMDQKDKNVYNLLGDISLKQLQYENAINYYKKSIELMDKDLSVYQNIGFAEAQIGNIDEAIVYYDKALEIDSKNTVILKNKQEIINKIKK